MLNHVVITPASRFKLSLPAEYRKAQVKEGTLVNVHPQLTVKGTGFSRLLGGLEMDIRLQLHLAKLFQVSHGFVLCLHACVCVCACTCYTM